MLFRSGGAALSDGEILGKIASWIEASSGRGQEIVGAVYVHSISDCRLHGDSHIHLGAFKTACGPTFYKHTAIMTTRRSEERRVGKECVSTCRSGVSPTH